jgi:hypothetical protein
MCVLCDGGTQDELFFSQFGKILKYGFTTVMVEAPSPWAYTIGLVQSFGHPELTLAGLPECCTSTVVCEVTDRIRDGERFDVSSPPLTFEWGTVRFGPVDPDQWAKGRFDAWLEYYRAVGGEPPPLDIVQVVWADREGRFPEHLAFDGDQALFAQAPRHNVNTGMNRKQRRRAKYGHGKRERR